MSGEFRELGSLRVFFCAAAGPALQSERDAVDLLGLAAEHGGADLVAIPVERLGADFLDLRSGIAGAFLQKFVTYRVCVAIIGDLSSALEQSRALRDFVVEANRGNSIWFVPDLETLERKIEAAAR
jgi:hypothetical protein